jgi:hypothetical protein
MVWYAIWIDNLGLSLRQVAEFCGLELSKL